MFRNVAYLPHEQLMKLYTWDENGNPITVDSTYEPYIYLETSHNEECMSIFNTKLKKKRFKNQMERSQYIKNNNIARIFENLGVQQQFLIDCFGGKNEDPGFASYPLKVFYIDIETYSPNSFPNIEKADHPINVITIYDSITEKFYTWGIKPYNKVNSNVIYNECGDERRLLTEFIKFFADNRPDILSGWNSEFFDIPYIINRVARVLSEEMVKRLSPIYSVRASEYMGMFGKQQMRYYIEGISCVDYLQIYKKFCTQLRSSYKLGDIGELEIGEAKVDYGDIDLASLSDDNWELFIDYNIQDVNLLVKLEKKLQYIQLLRMIAYAGLTTFEGALGSLSVITGLCAIRARVRGQRIPTFNKNKVDKLEQNAGAYVGEPLQGFQKHVVSFDANSLYPNMMITLNISPETKVGSIVDVSDKAVTIKHVNGSTFNLTKEKFSTFVKQEQISISKAKTLFSQKTKGIVPEIVDYYYDKRVKLKKQLAKVKRSILKAEKDTQEYNDLKYNLDNLNITQHTIKILINSIYGYFGNKYSPLGDDELAESITLTGQAAIKESNRILIEYIKKEASLTDDEIKLDSPIVYNDTDSSYISIKHLISSKNITVLDDKKRISPDYHKIVDDIEQHLNREIKEWGTRALNSIDCRLSFKREKISDVAVFLQKKRYVLHVLDDEGISCDKFKYTGVEVVRTAMPAAVKVYVRDIIETMMRTQSRVETDKVFADVYNKFMSLDVQEIALVRGITGYDKYAQKCSGFNICKGMPGHVKAAYLYNLMVQKISDKRKYEAIGSGDKVRYFYVRQPNKYGVKVMGYKYEYPSEFNAVFEPDYELIFEKEVYAAIERFYSAVGWQLKKPSEQVKVDLFELLS